MFTQILCSIYKIDSCLIVVKMNSNGRQSTQITRWVASQRSTVAFSTQWLHMPKSVTNFWFLAVTLEGQRHPSIMTPRKTTTSSSSIRMFTWTCTVRTMWSNSRRTLSIWDHLSKLESLVTQSKSSNTTSRNPRKLWITQTGMQMLKSRTDPKRKIKIQLQIRGSSRLLLAWRKSNRRSH